MNTYIVVYFGSAVISMLLVPVVFMLAKRYNLYDAPGPRKAHLKPIPRIGGFSFVVGTLSLIFPVFFLNNPIGQSFLGIKNQMIVLLAGACFVYIVGLMDDIKPLRGTIKLLSLVLAALALSYSGATIHTIQLGTWFKFNTGLAAVPLTVCWIVGITVCIGFIDGLDGLAAGIAAMVCATLVVISLWIGQVAMAVLMLALLGGITGFLIFNFYPAKIFMGDGGSLFLGFMIGASSVICQAKTPAFLALAVPFLVLGMPILDTGLVFAFRGFIKRRSLFAADNNHFHHRLLRLGLKHRSVVLIMYAITAICASLGIFMLTAEGNVSSQLMVAGLVLLLTMFACLQKGRYLKLFNGLRRNLAIAKQAKKQIRSFETAQVKMNESVSFDSWWQILCTMGENMNFKNITLLCYNNGRYISNCRWETSLENPCSNNRTVELNLPVGSGQDDELILSVKIFTEDYLELSGNQVKLLTRLIDEFPIPERQVKPETVDSPPIQNINSEMKEKKPEIKAINSGENFDYANINVSNIHRSHDAFSGSIWNTAIGIRNLFRKHK